MYYALANCIMCDDGVDWDAEPSQEGNHWKNLGNAGSEPSNDEWIYVDVVNQWSIKPRWGSSHHRQNLVRLEVHTFPSKVQRARVNKRSAWNPEPTEFTFEPGTLHRWIVVRAWYCRRSSSSVSMLGVHIAGKHQIVRYREGTLVPHMLRPFVAHDLKVQDIVTMKLCP